MFALLLFRLGKLAETVQSMIHCMLLLSLVNVKFEVMIIKYLQIFFKSYQQQNIHKKEQTKEKKKSKTICNLLGLTISLRAMSLSNYRIQLIIDYILSFFAHCCSCRRHCCRCRRHLRRRPPRHHFHHRVPRTDGDEASSQDGDNAQDEHN